VRAQLQISHEDNAGRNALETAFGPHNPAVLDASDFKRKSPQSAESINFAAQRPDARVLAWVTVAETRVYVESQAGQLRDAAGETWQLVHKKARRQKLQLKSLVLFDEAANDKIAEATVGIAENAKRTEIAIPLMIGAVTAIVLLIAVVAFDAPLDLGIGSVPALVAAILVLAWLVVDSWKGKLVWQ
jgi:hypothetical protein